MRAVRAVHSDNVAGYCSSGAATVGGQKGVDFMTDKVLPLLQMLAKALVGKQPSNLEAFLLVWLAERLHVPFGLVAELRSFLEGDWEEVLDHDDDACALVLRPPNGCKPAGLAPRPWPKALTDPAQSGMEPGRTDGAIDPGAATKRAPMQEPELSPWVPQQEFMIGCGSKVDAFFKEKWRPGTVIALPGAETWTVQCDSDETGIFTYTKCVRPQRVEASRTDVTPPPRAAEPPQPTPPKVSEKEQDAQEVRVEQSAEVRDETQAASEVTLEALPVGEWAKIPSDGVTELPTTGTSKPSTPQKSLSRVAIAASPTHEDCEDEKPSGKDKTGDHAGEQVGKALSFKDRDQVHPLHNTGQMDCSEPRRIAYLGSSMLVLNSTINSALHLLFKSLIESGYELTVGLANKWLGEETGARVVDTTYEPEDVFDAVLVAPGGPLIHTEAQRFSKYATLYYFINSRDGAYGQPEWLQSMTGLSETRDLLNFSVDDFKSRLHSDLASKAKADNSRPAFRKQASFDASYVSETESGWETRRFSAEQPKKEEKADTCPQCGNVFMPDASFCRKCGQSRNAGKEDKMRKSMSSDDRRKAAKRRGTMLANQRDSVCAAMAGFAAPNTEQRIELLRKTDTMKNMPLVDLKRIAEITSCRRFEPDELLINFAQKHEDMHIVLSGKGRIYVPQFVGSLEEGGIIAEQGLSKTRSLSTNQVVAGEQGVVTLSINEKDFKALQLKRAVEKADKMAKVVGKTAKAQPVVNETEAEEGFCSVCRHKLIPHEVNAREKELITRAMTNNPTLYDVMALSFDQCAAFADRAVLVEIPMGNPVFNKGDVGNAFFIVHEGLLTVHLPGGGDLPLRVGDSFGELALLYDEPRSATVSAQVTSRLWMISQELFRDLCKASAQQRVTRITNVLLNVPFLKEQIGEAACEIAAGLVDETVFQEGENICEKGQDDGLLFIVFEGECEYLGDGDPENDGEILRPGDYYGEKQVTKEVSSEETIFVRSEFAKVLILNRDSFNICRQASNAGVTSGELGANIQLESSREKLRRVVRSVLTDIRMRMLLKKLGKEEPMTVHSIQRCEKVGLLGEGSFGIVLLVKDRDTTQQYALKGISKQHLKEENQEDMVQHERSIMLLFQSPFLVALYQTYEDDNFLYLMLEPVFGGELYDVFMDTPLWGSVEHARFYMASVALGLNYMHSKRVVWRDLKLENCLVDSAGNIKLTDMGIAKVVIGLTYTVVGTADYLAPEILRQQGHNRAADWWASGILLYIMLAGTSPFDAPQVSQIYRNIVKGFTKVEFPDSVPRPAQNVIKALCKKKPEERTTMQKGGLYNLQSMSFFENLNWDLLEKRGLKPPWTPPPPDYEKIKSKESTRLCEVDFEQAREYVPQYTKRNSLSRQLSG